MIGSDNLEWLVSWLAGDGDEVAAIELLHEKAFSGLGRTTNVIFGR
jgi:hypothetical protein